MEYGLNKFFDSQYLLAQRAFVRKGFAECSMQKTYDDTLCWAPLAIWGMDRPQIFMWHGYWYPEVKETPYLWLGFQGFSSQIKRIVRFCRTNSELEIDARFLRYDALRYDDVQNKIVSEKDSVWNYFGIYLFDNSVSKFESIADALDKVIDCASDYDTAIGTNKVDFTEKEALILARRGQGLFRLKLEAFWKNGCAVTGCAVREILRASHIKPWKQSSNEERLDGNNGLLLSASLDALFDKGLISFTDAGTILFADRLSQHDRRLLALEGLTLRKPPTERQCKYLEMHRSMLN